MSVSRETREPWVQQVLDALAQSDERKRSVQIRLFRLYHVRHEALVSKRALWRSLKAKDYDWVPGWNVFFRMMSEIDRTVAEIRYRK